MCQRELPVNDSRNHEGKETWRKGNMEERKHGGKEIWGAENMGAVAFLGKI